MAQERLGEKLVRLYEKADARRKASPTARGRIKESLIQSAIAAAAFPLLPLAFIAYSADKYAERLERE